VAQTRNGPIGSPKIVFLTKRTVSAEAATLLNVAASVRNAACLAGSLTFECSITFEAESRGSPSAGPISIRPSGAMRRASGNTKDEKAAYLAALFPRMGELLGPLHEESNAHVDEVKGDAHGFGGLTQERRYIAGQLEVAPRKVAA